MANIDLLSLPITKDEVVNLSNDFFETVFQQGDVASFFMYDNPIIYIPHGRDLTLDENAAFNRQFTFVTQQPFEEVLITPLVDSPAKARCKFAIYWQAQSAYNEETIEAVIGQDWIVQRDVNGDLRINLLINSYHHFLPGSLVLNV